MDALRSVPRRRVIGLVAVALCLAAPAMFLPPAAAAPPAAAPPTHAVGDVLLDVAGSYYLKEFAPTGRLAAKYGAPPATPGNAVFDAAGDLLASTFFGPILRFDSQAHYLGVFADTAADGLPGLPRSLTVDAAGHVFVGALSRDINTENANVIREYDAAGDLIDHFTVATTDHSVANIDMSADQCTIHYTSGPSSVLSYNVCTRAQTAPVTTSLAGARNGLRELPGGRFLVALGNDVVLIDATGTVLRSYLPKPVYTTDLYTVKLDPDGTSFWTVDGLHGLVFRIRISDGALLKRFHVHSSLSGSGDDIAAVAAVHGEPTAGRSASGGQTG